MVMDISLLSETIGRLKDTPRKGWLLREVEAPESVADHSWGVCLLVVMLCPPELDRLKCLEFAVVHDLAESLTGDFVPADNIKAEEKHKRETEAVKQIAARAKCPRLEEIFALYERQDSAEARFVKKLDKLEAVLQARYYDNNKRSRYFIEKREYPSLFAEFEHNARPHIGALTEKIEKL